MFHILYFWKQKIQCRVRGKKIAEGKNIGLEVFSYSYSVPPMKSGLSTSTKRVHNYPLSTTLYKSLPFSIKNCYFSQSFDKLSSFGIKMGKRILKIALKSLKILFITIASILITYAIVFSITGTILIYKAYKFVSKPISEVVALKDHNPTESAYMSAYRQDLRAANQPDTLYSKFIPLDSISVNLKTVVIAAEDDGFYTHPGFDLEALLSAAEYNRTHGAIKRGASTITQQLAKNLFLSGEKSFERKFKELAYTLLMEHYLGKNRILELYLNYAQWGKNIFGCEAASRFYFKKSSHNLTRMEATRLAAVLAMPTRVSPLNTRSSFISKRIAAIANNLYLHGKIDDSGFINLTGFAPPKDSADTNTTIEPPSTPGQPDGSRLSF